MALNDRSAHWLRRLTAAVVLFTPGAAAAHVDQPHRGFVAAWNLAPDLLIGLAIFAALYAAGLWHHRNREAHAWRWKHAAFFCGLVALMIALISPLDAYAGRLFFMHQVQHLLLQTLAPMLLMLAAPHALLVGGVPETIRGRLLRPVISSRAVRVVFGLMTRPWIAAFLLVASMYVWQWPPYHNVSVLNDGVHYVMHITMLAAGLLFYACVFDPRPAPLGADYGTRINILWFTMTASMLLGAGLALKDTTLYSAYDELGRLWGLDALSDERLGGLIMWIPGSMISVPAFLVLLGKWGSRETRLDAQRRRGLMAPAGAVRAPNYRIAYWLALAAFVGFLGTIAVGLTSLD